MVLLWKILFFIILCVWFNLFYFVLFYLFLWYCYTLDGICIIHMYYICDEEYIWESGRTFAERFREHMKASSPIHDHHITGHKVSLDNFSLMGREDQSIARTIKEAILIRVNDASLNRKYWQIPTATHMGWGIGQVTKTQIQINNKSHNIRAMVTPWHPHGSTISWTNNQ